MGGGGRVYCLLQVAVAVDEECVLTEICPLQLLLHEGRGGVTKQRVWVGDIAGIGESGRWLVACDLRTRVSQQNMGCGATVPSLTPTHIKNNVTLAHNSPCTS